MEQAKKIILSLFVISSIVIVNSALLAQKKESLQDRVTFLEKQLNKQNLLLANAQTILVKRIDKRLHSFYDGQDLFLEDIANIKQKQQKIIDQYERLENQVYKQGLVLDKLEATIEKQQKELLLQAEEKKKKPTVNTITKNPPKPIQKKNTFITEQEKTLLKRAYTFLQKNDPIQAAKTFNELYQFNKVGHYAPLALFSIGTIYFKKQNWSFSESYFLKVLTFFSTNTIIPRTQWFLAQTWEKQHKSKQARDLYHILASSVNNYTTQAQDKYITLSQYRVQTTK